MKQRHLENTFIMKSYSFSGITSFCLKNLLFTQQQQSEALLERLKILDKKNK